MQKRPLKASETLDLKTPGSLFNVGKKTNETPNVSFAFPVAVRCSAVQCVAVCCSGRMRPRMSHSLFLLQCVAVRCSALQCAAVCCSALQCVAVDE